MRIILGADHGGFELKEEIKKWLTEEKHDVSDVGATGLNPEDDFVEFAEAVAEGVAGSDNARGILFCRKGLL